QSMAALATDDRVRAVVVTGAGERAFTAGVDLKELGAHQEALDSVNGDNPLHNPTAAVRSTGKPVIGAVNGVCVAGGFELALACDFLYASDAASFADTHVLVGLMPTWGMSQRLQRRIGMARAMQMSFSGRYIDAQTALQWGLVNAVVAQSELLSTACDMASAIASIEPLYIEQYRHLIEEGAAQPLDAALAFEQAYSVACNGDLTPEEIESRRAAILARGRSQKS
ncbi:MAG: enoyl-CoA hydratase, partial [Pseudomonadota bacterium]